MKLFCDSKRNFILKVPTYFNGKRIYRDVKFRFLPEIFRILDYYFDAEGIHSVLNRIFYFISKIKFSDYRKQNLSPYIVTTLVVDIFLI